MKLYGIIEVYQDYKGADATNWGVSKSLEEALKSLRGIIEQQFHYIRENIIYEVEEELGLETQAEVDEHLEEIDSRWTEWIEDHLDEGDYGKCYTYKWEYDDGDCVYKFYIDEINLDM